MKLRVLLYFSERPIQFISIFVRFDQAIFRVVKKIFSEYNLFNTFSVYKA